MADQELTSGQLDDPAPSTPPTGTSDEQAPGTGQDAPQSSAPAQQTSGDAAPKQQAPKVNLFESQEFKAWQATQNRQQAQLQQQLAQMHTRLREAETRGMDDDEKTQYRVRELEDEIQRRDAMVQSYQAELQRERDMLNIATKTGAPVEMLRQAGTYDEAWELAFSHATNQRTQQQQAAQQATRQAANTVDLGGGAPRGAGSDFQARYDKAMKEYNTSTALDIMFEAERAGVELRL